MAKYLSQVLTTNLENVIITDVGMYLAGNELYGVVLARVLCPQNLLYPFLMVRNEASGKVTLPVCRLCNELETTQKCKHSIR